MSLLKVLSKIEQHIPKPFLCPIPQTNIVSCFTIQDQIPYWFDLTHPQSGWWWVEPISKNEAKLVHEAQPHEYLSYLLQLPRFIVIAVERTKEGLIVVPYNASDASQRGWLNSELRFVYLSRSVLFQPFSTLVVRNMAGTLLFDDFYPLNIKEQFRLCDALENNYQVSTMTNFQVAWQILVSRKEEERKRQLERQKKELLKTERGQIEDRLQFVGAELIDYQKQGSNFDVTYTYNGAQFTVNVRPDLRIESAGICLSDEDRNYDLSSICLVMEEARRLGRPGIREEYLL